MAFGAHSDQYPDTHSDFMCDALGNMIDFVLLPGQRHDTVGVADLISDWEFEGFIADTAFDADWITRNSSSETHSRV